MGSPSLDHICSTPCIDLDLSGMCYVTQGRLWASHSSKEVVGLSPSWLRSFGGLISFPEVPLCFLQNHAVNNRPQFLEHLTARQVLS